MAKKKVSKKKVSKKDPTERKRSKVSQKDFPRVSLAKALTIAEAIWDNFAGKGGAPHDIAIAIDLSPTSGGWRNLSGTSVAYGLTEGGYNATEMVLTDLGRKIVAPQEEGDDVDAKVVSILQPKIMADFFNKYDKAKFPKDMIAENVLVGMGLPKERAKKAIGVIKENGIFTGVLKDTKTGLFVSLGSPSPSSVVSAEEPTEDVGTEIELGENIEVSELEASQGDIIPPNKNNSKENNKVFISHGKDKKILQQLKELLTFGKFDPIVSVEKETVSISVPDKVFDDMRYCSAAVIHVDVEEELMDAQGNKHVKINENVLIEIGAAMALYKKNFVLLVKKGVSLPTNLQGLYRCEYEGEQLDYNATMKLLKTFNQFNK